MSADTLLPDLLKPFYEEVGRAIVGQRRLLDRLLVGLMVSGHVLIEGPPGVAKTLVVRSAASALALRFSRIQFTPDLLPSDVIGTQVYHPASGEFRTRQGPVFTNLLLADEINRAPAKVQSALLEAMQERQVTIGDETFALPEPFLVMATQNPLEQEGTFPLPEAQLDRFLFHVVIGYPERSEERLILERTGQVAPQAVLRPVLGANDLAILRKAVDAVHAAEPVKDYVLDLIQATREPAKCGLDELTPLIRAGASPRAARALYLAAKGQAVLGGRDYVLPQDVKDVARDVLRHRLILTYEAEAEEMTADDLLQRLLRQVPVP